MAFAIADSEKQDLLTQLARFALTLHLSSTDPGINGGSASADFAEISDSGYAPIPLSSGSWVPSMMGHVAIITYPQQSWTFIGDQTIAAYWLEKGGTFYLGEALIGGPLDVAGGIAFNLVIQISDGDCVVCP